MGLNHCVQGGAFTDPGSKGGRAREGEEGHFSSSLSTHRLYSWPVFTSQLHPLATAHLRLRALRSGRPVSSRSGPGVLLGAASSSCSCSVAQSRLTLRDPTDCIARPRLLCPWDSPGKHTGVGCHFLLQGNLPNPGVQPASPALTCGFFTAAGPPFRRC